MSEDFPLKTIMIICDSSHYYNLFQGKSKENILIKFLLTCDSNTSFVSTLSL